MTEYELLLLFKPNLSEEDIQKAIATVQDIVTTHEAQITGEDHWGKRKLSYEIDHEQMGTYHLMTFSSPGDALKNIENALKLDKNVMRFQIVKRVPLMSINEDKLVQPEHRKTRVKPDDSKAEPPKQKSIEPDQKVDLDELDKKLDKILDEDVVQ